MEHAKALFPIETKKEEIKRIKVDKTLQKQMLKFQKEALAIDKWLTKHNAQVDQLINSIKI